MSENAVVRYCASINFQGTENVYPENVSKVLREEVGHATVLGTVATMFATDPAQRLTRQEINELMERVHGERGHVLFEHCWHALAIPEPDRPFIDGVDQWQLIERTKRFLRESLADEKVWSEYRRYVKAVVDTDWYETIRLGTDEQKEWCIRTHVKFLSPVEEAQLLGALRLTVAKLKEQDPSVVASCKDLMHGKAPESFRRTFAETFVNELGLQDSFPTGGKEWNETVDYFVRAFGIRAFWEGGRPDAVESQIPEMPA